MEEAVPAPSGPGAVRFLPEGLPADGAQHGVLHAVRGSAVAARRFALSVRFGEPDKRGRDQRRAGLFGWEGLKARPHPHDCRSPPVRDCKHEALQRLDAEPPSCPGGREADPPPRMADCRDRSEREAGLGVGSRVREGAVIGRQRCVVIPVRVVPNQQAGGRDSLVESCKAAQPARAKSTAK